MEVIVNAYLWKLCISMLQYRCLNWGTADCVGVAARLWSAELIVSKLISANATLPRHWWWMVAVTAGSGHLTPGTLMIGWYDDGPTSSVAHTTQSSRHDKQAFGFISLSSSFWRMAPVLGNGILDDRKKAHNALHVCSYEQFVRLPQVGKVIEEIQV